MGPQELLVQQKREVDGAEEATRPLRAFLATTDIFETEDALTVVLEMPGVAKQNVDISIEHGVAHGRGPHRFRQVPGSAAPLQRVQYRALSA